MKILIITAECGEAQFKKQLQQLNGQKNVTITHEIISNLNLKDAQTMVYKICHLNRDSDYDFIIKLDGDMLLKDNMSLIKMCEHARKIKYPRITFKVFDYYTNRSINGVHFLVPKYIPNKRPIVEHRNDYWIETIKGKNTRQYADEILHGFNSTIEQCVRFGISRGIKANCDGANSSHWRTIYFLNKNAYNPRIKPDLILALESALTQSKLLKFINRKKNITSISKLEFFYLHFKMYNKLASSLIHLVKTTYLEIKHGI